MELTRKVKPFYIDYRGKMIHLLDGKVKILSALLIFSKKGTVRANHYHKKDTHYSYMIKGEMAYTYQEVGKKMPKKKTVIVSKGDLVKTPPMEAHAMKFIKDSIFLALSTEKRDPVRYEKDTVRVKLV